MSKTTVNPLRKKNPNWQTDLSVFFFFSGLREISISKMLKNNTSQEVGKAIKKLVKEDLILRVPEERRKTYMCIEYYSVSAGNSVKSDFFQHISPTMLA